MKLELYKPHLNQIKVHESQSRYRVVVAGRRFGKSALALNEALARGFQLRDQIIWIILPLFKQAKEIYWIDPDITKYFMPLVQRGLIKMDNSELSLHIKLTNSWIRLKGSDNYEGLRGSGLDLVIWDEVADVKELAFEVIKPSLADSPSHRMLYIGTPKGINWFHDFALNGDHEGIIPNFGKSIKIKKDWQTWHFTSYDNLAWEEGSRERKKFVEFIDRQKQELSERGRISFFNQEYLAQFDQSTGQFFREFRYDLHIIKRYFPSKSNVLIGGMDWGRVAPFAFILNELKQINLEGLKFYRIISFLEVYGTDKTPKEWSTIIKEKLNQFNLKIEDVSWIRGDPSMFTKGQDKSISIADQFIAEGIRIKPASNDRVGGWENMHKWLSIAPDDLPYWQISGECKNLLQELPQLVYDENKPTEEDVDTNCLDHASDSMRYALKALKWLGARLGAIRHSDIQTRARTTAEFIGPKQVSVDLSKFELPKITTSSSGVGGIIHR